MDPAILGLILDSSVVIKAERARLDAADLLRSIARHVGDAEAALCSITVAELAHGVHRADTAERRQARRGFLDDLKAALPVYPITAETGELLGKLNASLSSKGIVVPFDDLLIGACALERGYAVATRNSRHFGKIPGLRLITV